MNHAKPLAVALAALFSNVSAHAVLNAVDPGPYVAANGFFPAWYQDTDGRVLDLCLSKAVSSRVPGAPGAPSYMCTLLPNPGIFDDAQPIVFPSNFPDEAFWFTGDATITANGVDLTYVSGLEAAFGSGVPQANDQVSFARIRIRVSLPATAPAGNYIVTHPYGVETFKLDAGGGIKVINLTRDIGIGAIGDFTGALKGDIGPFLRGVNGPYSETNPDTLQLETFVGDPNLTEPVTGSPFGTNFVRIEGPAGFATLETNLFAVSGKVSDVVLPTPLVIERSTYGRALGIAGAVAQQDVFARAPASSTPVEFIDANGTTNPMTDGNANGAWYGQSPGDPSLPATVTVAATNAANNNVQTVKTSKLTDLITVTRADYSAGTLTVEALSSDEVSIPVLTVNGQPLSLVGAGPLQRATLTGFLIPPARVTVESPNGGSDTEEVNVLP